MTDLEKMLRNALDKGKTSGELAETLGNILKKVEEEKERDDAAKLAAEAAEREKAKEKEACSDFVTKCVDEFDNHWCNDDELTARDAALVALVVARQNKANKDWTLGELTEFVDSMTKVIQFNLDMREGSADAKTKGERAFQMLAKEIGNALDETGIRAKVERFPFDTLFQKMTEASKDVARHPGGPLQEWLEKQGW